MMSAVGLRAAAVLGPTGWGTMLALLLAANEVPTTLFTRTPEEAERLNRDGENRRHLPGARFPAQLCASADGSALRSAELVVFAVPSQAMRQNARQVAAAVPAEAILLTGTKGIEAETQLRMSEVLCAELPGRSVAALSGPNLSREVAQGLPGSTVIASADAPLEVLRAAFHSTTFRVYTSNDIIGVELGGALKNIIAIAAGMVDAFAYGDNAKATVITRGLAEITRLGVAAGANPLTFQGLAGIGDLIATSYSPLSRNRRLGELVAGGQSMEQALRAIGETAEGASTTPAALRLARTLGVELPIAEGLHAILYESVSPADAVETLLGRVPTRELS